jgi:D-glycero-alpha-D-manno-heptose-7-phosphate kinase
MILVRSPLRISIGGGGTDLPSYYENYGGFVLSAAIDKYVYVALNKPFSDQFVLKYSKFESVGKIEEIQHPIIRESLRLFKSANARIEISTMADVPAGTGLGSSGSFTTAILKALSVYFYKPIQAEDLAQLACKIEIELLKEPIGKQDQYIAAYGGFTAFEFRSNGRVLAESLELNSNVIHNLEDNLLLFYTGTSRSASSILIDQDKKTSSRDVSMLENLHFVKELGLTSRNLLISGDLVGLAELMNEHWKIKKSRSTGITSDYIDAAYDLALKNGALGGKLVGAGGGGFLLFYANDPENLRSCMDRLGMEEVRFKFDFQGTAVVST